MDWALYIAFGVGAAVFIGTRIAWRRKTYADVLTPYLSKHGCALVKVEIPRFWDTGPFPRVTVRIGGVQSRIAGVRTTHFEHRIVTFCDSGGRQRRRWVRLLLHPFGVQDIIWEPGTTEVLDKKGWPTA